MYLLLDLVFCVVLENPTLVTDFHCNGLNHGDCNGKSGATNHNILPPLLHHHHPSPIVTFNDVSSSINQLPNVTISSGSPPDLISSGYANVIDCFTPSLGENYRIDIRVRESKEYKSTVDALLKVRLI